MMSGIGYTKALTEYVIEKASESEIVKKQLENEDVNVFSGKAFDDDNTETGLDFNDMISIDTDLLSSAFNVKINQDDITAMTEGYMGRISSAITTDTSKAQTAFTNALSTLTKDLLNTYISENAVAGVATLKTSQVDKVVSDFMAKDSTKATLAKLESDYLIPQKTLSDTVYTPLIKGFLTQYIGMSNASSNTNTKANTNTNSKDQSAFLVSSAVNQMVDAFVAQDMVKTSFQTLSATATEANMQKTILTAVGELSAELMGTMADAFNVDEDKIAAAFKFDLDEEEMKRLFQTMSTSSIESADANLISLGYQDLNEPTAISFYFIDFDSKELFIDFLDEYNEKMEKEDEDKVIKYTDITGILMSSVKVIVDSVSYVLIAFVSISLIVSSIMIGIITYISVLERTKEIGVLRAIGASKKNISSIFNAETFIVGLFSGLIGIVITILLLFPINYIIHALTGNPDIIAVLPTVGGIVLVLLSVILTLIGGLIPSKAAAKKDPVLALRTE